MLTSRVYLTEAGLLVQVRELLLPLVADTETSMEVGGAAALALGHVFISSQDEDAVGAALQVRNCLCRVLPSLYSFVLSLSFAGAAPSSCLVAKQQNLCILKRLDLQLHQRVCPDSHRARSKLLRGEMLW